MAFSDAYIREKVKNEHSNFSDNYLNSKGDGSEAYKRRLYLLENQAPVSVQPTVSTVSRSTSQVYKTSGKTSKEWQDEIDKLTKSRTKLNDEYSYANAYVVGMQRSGTNSKDDIKNATDYANTLKQQLSELDAQIENAKSGKWAVDNESKYSGIEKNSDFKEKSAVERSSVKGWDETYRYINDVDGAKEKRDNTIGGSVLLGENYDKYNYMSQQEIATYNYLYNTQGKKNANEYLDYLTYDLDYRRTQTNVAGWSDDATKKPVATSAASVGSNLVSGVGLVDVAAQNAARNVSGFFGGEYKPINYYGQAMDTTNYTTAVRGTISSNLANEYGTIEINEDEHPLLASIFNGKSIGDVYQLGMSMVDSTATAAIGKLTGIGSSGAVLLGGRAGSQGVLTALENGATDEQALAMGLLNGAFESLFEYVSLDKLLNGNTNGILKNVLEQGFIEGTEEFNTTLFNTIADICVMAEKSDYKRTVNQYVEHGLSQVEAETKAMQDIAIGMGWDFIGGAISGGLMGGSKAALINAYQSSQAKKIYGDNVQSLVDESKEINPDSKLAKTVSEKLESGKKVSGRSIKNLVAENESGMISNDKAAIKKAVATQLEQYGETGDVDAISSAIAKQTAGEKLTSSEQETIRSGKYSQRVLNELNQENYGEYNTEWVEKINTDRVDVNSYSRMLRSSQMAQNAPESVSAEQSQKDTTHAANVQQRETVPQKSGIKATNLTDSVKVKVAPTIEEEARRYGKQSEAFIHTMIAGQDAEQYATAYRYAFNYAKAGVPLKTIKTLETTSYLTDTQKQIAYDTAMASLNAEETTATASGKVTIRKKGAVRLDGANYSELNDQQKRATSVVRNIAEATGVNVVLYKGNIAETERTGLKEEGHYSKKENTIYVDITAGIFAEADAKKIGQYTMLRTFTHEFAHFVERENAPEYRTLRELVLARIDENAEKNGGLTSVELIKAKMELYGNRLSGENLEDEASREVVADALADMLPQSSFAQQIYDENQSLFEKIVDKLKQFVADLKSYFDNLTALDKPEARMLKQEINGQIKYAQDIVDAFDKAAKGAAANHQAKNGAKKAADDGGAQYSVSQRDSEYMDAVERGDTEAAQKMVDDVAKDNGYNILAYHGSRSIFNTFSKNRLGSNTNTESSKKWFFAADKETANSYYPYGAMKYLEEHNPNLFKAGTADNMKQKGKLYNLYLKGENPLVVDVKDYDYASHREKADAWVEYIQEAEKNGNDVIILLNALDNQLKTGARESTVYMFRNPAQVKSADSVTYDDNGKVIPLSERFNSDEEDIRYSLTTNAERDIRQAATAQGYRGDVVLSDTTPQIMTSQRDVKNLPFVMRGDHIRQNILTETEARSMGLNVDEHTHYHGIGADKFIEIMDNLDNVKEAYRGTKNASDPIRGTRYFVLVPNVKDSAGNDIVAFVYINEKSEQNSVYIDVNKAATVFGKEGLREYINRELSRKNIVRIKNRGPISSEPRALIAHDYTDVTSSEVAANQAAMATYGSNVAQTSESVNKKDLTDSDQRSLSERPDRMSDTEVLVRAAEAVQAKDAATSRLTAAQKDALSIMLKRAQKLYDEQQRKEKMVATKRRILRGRNVSELNAAEADSLANVTNNINTVNGIIRRAEAELAQVENSKVIKEVLGTARKMVESDAKKRGNEAADKAALAEQVFYGRQIHRIKESSKRRELRESIGRTAKSFRQMLLHATDSKYAPVDLMQSCLDVALMLDTSGERDGTKSKVKFNNMMDALRTMKEQYDELAKSDDSDFSTEYDKDFAFMVQQLAKSIGNKPVRELTNAQLQDVHDVLHDINAMLRDARFQIGKADKVTNYSVGDRIIREARSVPVRTKVESAADASFRLTGSVLRNIRRITLYNDDAALAHLFADLNEGIRKKNTFIMESTQLFERFAGERYVKSSKEVKQYNTGTRKIAMTEMEAMQLVLTWERELSGKTKHLSEGGAVIPVQEWMNRGKYQDAIIKAPTAHRIEQHEIIAIQKTFDGWANDYMDTARKFFNGKAKNAINNTTMQTKHRAIAMSENYIPIEVDKNVIASELEGVKFDATIEGMGMLKSVVKGASSPVVIRGLDQVIESHIERVGQLYGLAIPVRNFDKAFNVKQVDSGMTPRKAIGMAWNADDVKLIEQALTDLQTRRATAQDGVSKTLRKAQGAFVKSTLLSNVSVTIKQAASYSTAGLYLSQKALAPYQGTIAKLFANNESKFAKDLFSEIDEHTATHYMRRKGMSMQEINTIAQDTSKIVRKMDEKLPDAANPLKWIQNMDVATTAALWLASKKQVELDGGKQTDADYWNKVTELYDKVIEETQPMYDTLHRPEIQKTTNELVRSIVMFRTQPLQNAGILYDAASELAAAKKYGDDATIKSATKKLRNAAVSQLASLAVFATMSFLAYAVRNRLGRYKDDEDELTVMSIIGRILGDMGNNAAQLALPIGGGELAGLIEKSVTGSRYGGEFSVPVVDMANDFISATSKVWKDIAEFEDGGNENLLEDVKELSMQTAGFFSIPAKNVHNIFVGIIGNVTDLAGTPISWATDIPDPNMKAAYAAFDNGHFDAAKEKIKGVIDSKVEAGKTSKEAKSAVKSSMTSHWKPLYLKAYRRKDNEEMKRIRKIMHASGVYGGANNVVESCQSWVKKANEK